MRQRKIEKDDYISYLEANRYASTREVAEHFGIKKTLVASHLREYGIRLRDFRPKGYHGISYEEICNYSVNHTKNEIIEHFGIPAIISYINREKIPYVKDAHRGRKLIGDEPCMMYVLSRYYSLASIARMFGRTREWIRQVVMSFERGERKLPDLPLRDLSAGEIFGEND
jgi:hypothetical protein